MKLKVNKIQEASGLPKPSTIVGHLEDVLNKSHGGGYAGLEWAVNDLGHDRLFVMARYEREPEEEDLLNAIYDALGPYAWEGLYKVTDTALAPNGDEHWECVLDFNVKPEAYGDLVPTDDMTEKLGESLKELRQAIEQALIVAAGKGHDNYLQAGIDEDGVVIDTPRTASRRWVRVEPVAGTYMVAAFDKALGIDTCEEFEDMQEAATYAAETAQDMARQAWLKLGD